MRTTLTSLVVVAVALAAPSRADTPDDHYLAALTSQGIAGDPGQLIADGHQACDGNSNLALLTLTYQLMEQGYSTGQASNVIMDGYRAYCPEKLPGGIPLP